MRFIKETTNECGENVLHFSSDNVTDEDAECLSARCDGIDGGFRLPPKFATICKDGEYRCLYTEKEVLDILKDYKAFLEEKREKLKLEDDEIKRFNRNIDIARVATELAMVAFILIITVLNAFGIIT